VARARQRGPAQGLPHRGGDAHLPLVGGRLARAVRGADSGFKTLGLSRGLDVPQRALLVRGASASPYGEGWISQYEVPVVVQIGEPEVVFTKGEPAMLALEFVALEDPDAASDDERFGRLIAQNSDPT
jgi:hypothetical protein